MIGAETLTVNGARMEIAPDYNTLSSRLAEVYVGRVAVKPNLVTMTPTGESPLGWYTRLAERAEKQIGIFGNVNFFNLDEYCVVKNGDCELLPADDERSYRFYMRGIAASLGVAGSYFPGAENYLRPGTYDKQIADAGGIDFAVLGLGPDHACGFNFAGSPIDSVTRHVAVSQITRKVNATITEIASAEEIPTDAITAGVGTVMRAKEAWTIAYGQRKSEPIYRALYEPISADNPATFLRRHPNHVFLIDEAAASMI